VGSGDDGARDCGGAVTRDEAIRIGIAALAKGHAHDHGERCVCAEGERLGVRSAAVIDALIADGVTFDHTRTDNGSPGPPVVG
jgi:hypothetical protein